MMSMAQLLAALNSLEKGPQFVAWAWDAPPEADAWGTVAPDGARADWAGSRMEDQSITGTVDLFCRGNIADYVDAVQAVLQGSGMAWRLGDFLYDSSVRAAHIVWDVETVGGL